MSRLRADGIVNISAGSGERVAPGWELVASLGSGLLYHAASSLPDAIGVDLFHVDTAVDIGARPLHATALDLTGHFDAAAITGKLTRLGATPHRFGSVRGLSTPTHALTAKLADRGLFFGSALKNVIVTDTKFAASSDAGELLGETGSVRPRSNTDDYARVASCLDDVVAALVLTPTANSNSRVIAVGVRDPGSATASLHEVLCSAPVPGKEAAVRTAVTHAFAPGAGDPTTGNPVSRSVASAQISDADGIIRAVLSMRSSFAGYLITGLDRGAGAYWDGSCPASRLAQGRC